MSIVAISPSISGVQARLLRHPKPYPQGMRYELQESNDSVTWVGSRAFRHRFASSLPAKLEFQRFLDAHYRGTNFEDCVIPRFKDDHEDFEMETDSQQCERMAELARRIPGGYGELVSFLDNMVSKLSDRKSEFRAGESADSEYLVWHVSDPDNAVAAVFPGEHRDRVIGLIVQDPAPKRVFVVTDNEGPAVSAHTSREEAEKAMRDHQVGLEYSGSNRTAYIRELPLDPQG